jgi:hypothetical protein
MPGTHTIRMKNIRKDSKAAGPTTDYFSKATREKKMTGQYKIILVGLVACAIAALIIFAFVRHQTYKQEAEWCQDHGYGNYATKDGFCVGPGGKLIKINL